MGYDLNNSKVIIFDRPKLRSSWQQLIFDSQSLMCAKTSGIKLKQVGCTRFLIKYKYLYLFAIICNCC